MTKIAVSGDAGSFSEEAGLLYSQHEGVESEIVYAIDMAGVLSLVEKGGVALGIFPVVNSTGGLVQTAFEAMGRHLFFFLSIFPMEVHQCLMVLPGVEKESVKKIVTHPQAISQCKQYISREFPQAELVDWQDTAKAARDLSNGVLSKDAAVIAPARSAEIYNLQLLEKGIQDNHPNLTTFIVVKKFSS